jgi:hypothetical protein
MDDEQETESRRLLELASGLWLGKHRQQRLIWSGRFKTADFRFDFK